MNKLVKRGFSAYKVFLKNKLASSIMMAFSGAMMFIAALNGHGNDTKTLPILITVVGIVLTLWAVYRFGYVKSNFDMKRELVRGGVVVERKALLMQLAEALVYGAVAGLGVFLLVNEGLMDKVLNLMAGGFTILNGVLGAISAYKNRMNKDFRWKLMLVLTVFELIIGPYFVFGSDGIGISGYIIMGLITMVAGTIEVISAATRENIKGAVDDGKEIVRIIKDEKNNN